MDIAAVQDNWQPALQLSCQLACLLHYYVRSSFCQYRQGRVHCIFTSTLGENPIGKQTLYSPCYYHSPFGTVIVTRVCPFQMLFEHGQTPLYSGICMKNLCKYTSNVETVNSNLTGHIPAIQCHTVFEQFRKTVYDRDGKKGIWTLFFYHWHFTVPVERPAADGRAVPAGQT